MHSLQKTAAEIRHTGSEESSQKCYYYQGPCIFLWNNIISENRIHRGKVDVLLCDDSCNRDLESPRNIQILFPFAQTEKALT